MSLNAQGTEFRGTHLRLAAGNKFYTRNWQLTIEVAAVLSNYGARSEGARHDEFLAGEALASRKLGRTTSLLLHLAYGQNHSSEDQLYSYQRLVAGAGLRYLF
jgi:hypothetical protein